MKFQRILFLFLFSLATLLTACASQESRDRMTDTRSKANPHPAAYGMDGFYLDYRSPKDRPAQKWEFFFKDCEFVSHRPFPLQSEYDCQGPH